MYGLTGEWFGLGEAGSRGVKWNELVKQPSEFVYERDGVASWVDEITESLSLG